MALRNAWTRHRLTLVWSLAALLIALTLGSIVQLVEDARAREMATAQRELSTLTRLAQEHAQRTLRSADQVIRFVTERYLALGDRLDLAALHRAGVMDDEIVTQVAILNAGGQTTHAMQALGAHSEGFDSEAFKVHVASKEVGLFVSKPVLERANGNWSVQLTRRITLPNGDFGGVVLLSLDPRYFTHFYADLQLGHSGLLVLSGLDGIARARRSGADEDFGSNALGSRMFALMAQGESAGSYTERSSDDPVQRLTDFRKIPGYALVFSAAVDANALWANFQPTRNALYGQAGLQCLLILALALGLSHYLAGLRRATQERLLAQGLVQDRTEQLDAIFALSPDGFVSFDRQGRVTYLNPAFSQMTQSADATLEGMDGAAFSHWLSARCVPGSAFAGLAPLRQRLQAGQTDACERIEIAAASRTILQVTLRWSDAQAAQILYLRDVTHEAVVDERKSEFLATAAHELRTPLASILGFSELLQHETDPGAHGKFVGILHAQSKVMAKILDEMLDLARIEARRDKDFDYTLLDLKDLCTQVVQALPPQRCLPEWVLPEAPVYVLADEGQLHRALLHVLTNAYKYSPKGGPVQFSIALQHPQGRPAQVQIQITDQGLGMTPEQLSRVFERFYRGDSSGRHSGAGLGMSVAKEIIELHQGQIAIETVYGKGTRVSIFLPMGQP